MNEVEQVGLPYLRAKAQDYFEALGGGIDPSVVDDDTVNLANVAPTNEVSVSELTCLRRD